MTYRGNIDKNSIKELYYTYNLIKLVKWGESLMITFLCAIATLLLGYIIYGGFVERIFKPTNAPTPAVLHNDGVDYIPLPKWKNFLIIFAIVCAGLFLRKVYLEKSD